MRKRVVLVGHCSPDSSYLSIAVRAVVPDASVVRANDQATLDRLLNEGVDLLMVNRVLDGDFADYSGLGIIEACRVACPNTRVMMISNYPEAQQAAHKLGAVPGFGKSEVSTAKARDALAWALGGPTL